MAEGRQASDWQRTAALMALTANIHRDASHGRPFAVDDFNPHAKPRGRTHPLERVRLRELKKGFRKGGMSVQAFDPAWIVRPKPSTN